MRKVDFKALEQELSRMEGQATASATNFPAGSFVRDPVKGSQIQVYGLDDATSGQSLPTVVCIGGNYSQAKTTVPRDSRFGSMVLDDLASCRSNLRKAFDHYGGAAARWVGACAASSATIPIPKEGHFHLIMTNFCIWITEESWQNIGAQVRADLLENNVLFSGRGTQPGEWEHLKALREILREREVIWVGHGIHCEVSALFRQFMRGESAHWLLMPNLAFYYDYTNWNLLKGIPETNRA